ncbi:RDD family protein [Salimicrobium jeotgali]|uniref:RDD family protein n=1 Tax=Salimicrobium jeotgali TaxID=1230341 RepID=K2GPY3_9BACI|nr:RDD family protein [Salimicrobium jeotgali]AKG05180.1 RDD family protein [Salimicrobium jeotgali]EKE32444.1 hypothetical protein MJ3_03387 [Salimicrobium jeotgali]MBM7695574.1 putative RDD family membrane protein YckC [Salimicrobium jeotgali]
MKPVTKKRTYAVLIDIAFSGIINAAAENFLRKKVKNEAFLTLVLPTLITWGMEYGQLKYSGQTLGYKLMELRLESGDGSPLTSGQILKRIAHRDFASSIAYMRDRKNFSRDEGRSLAQDRFAGTIVTTKST